MENDPDIVAMVAASAALTLSGVPFLGPIGAARVGYIDGKYVLNPMIDEMRESSLDLVVAGTADAVLMVESEAKELSEDVMLGAVMYGQKHFQPVLDAIVKLAERAAKEPWELKPKDDGGARQARARARREPSCARPIRSPPSMSAATRVAAIKDEGRGGAGAGRRRRHDGGQSGEPPSRRRRRTWCARASSTPSTASTGAT